MGRDSRNRAGERELLQAPFMANRGRRRRGGRGVDGSEAGGELGKKGVVDLATSPAGKTGKALRRTAYGVRSFGRRRPPYRALCGTGRREGERMTGGAHV